MVSKYRTRLYKMLLQIKFGYHIIQFLYNKIFPLVYDIKTIFYLFLIKKKKYNEIPYVLTLSPSNICNASCIFCAYRKINDKKHIMHFETFKKVIDEFVILKGRQINLTPTVGEAFIDSKIFNKIKYAKSKGLIVKLYTNGIFLSKNNNYKMVIDSKIDYLTISLSDVNADIESKILSIDKHTAANKISGIIKLIKENEKQIKIKKIHLSFRPMRPPRLIMKEKKFKQIQKYKKISYDFLLGYDNWGGKIDKNDLKGIMKLRNPSKLKKYPCIRLYNSITILPDGDVRLCGCRIKDTEKDDLVVGNINKTSLKDILTNNNVKNIRNKFKLNIYPDVCKECSFYEP